jgi:spermidine/putrescine transport system permease protein
MALLQDTGIINSFLMKIGIDPVHMINTQGAVILGMVYNFLPFMITPIYSVMAKLDHSMIEACQDLGGNRLTCVRRCIIPMSMPGVVSGITMVFVPAVSTFYISQKLGNGKITLVGDTIEYQFKYVDNGYHVGAAFSLLLMLLILACTAIMNRFTDGEDGILM